MLWLETLVHAGSTKTVPVVPAKAGTHSELAQANALWIPAFAGMTEGSASVKLLFLSRKVAR